ncbi:MAG: thermonuclease family protein [Rhodobacterales bacterium]|nr:thermonuclease family protein [Rhodobacterales bacterium]
MFRICSAFLLSICAAAALAEIAGPVAVIDGDTLDVGGTRVRLYGIDAVELSQSCTTEQGVVWACGLWVRDVLRARYQGAAVVCERIDTDRYGRAVARCVHDGQDIGAALVADGLAEAYRRYSMDYDLIEKQAYVAGRGLWSGQVQSPESYRAARVAASPPPADPECAIKGNISAGGRIYHMPQDRDYARTRIDTGAGERWFCSEAAARAAGWRRARG